MMRQRSAHSRHSEVGRDQSTPPPFLLSQRERELGGEDILSGLGSRYLGLCA